MTDDSTSTSYGKIWGTLDGNFLCGIEDTLQLKFEENRGDQLWTWHPPFLIPAKSSATLPNTLNVHACEMSEISNAMESLQNLRRSWPGNDAKNLIYCNLRTVLLSWHKKRTIKLPRRVRCKWFTKRKQHS